MLLLVHIACIGTDATCFTEKKEESQQYQEPTKSSGCVGFVWEHADSFLHCVASPFHSFVTTKNSERPKQMACARKSAVPALPPTPKTGLRKPWKISFNPGTTTQKSGEHTEPSNEGRGGGHGCSSWRLQTGTVVISRRVIPRHRIAGRCGQIHSKPVLPLGVCIYRTPLTSLTAEAASLCVTQATMDDSVMAVRG